MPEEASRIDMIGDVKKLVQQEPWRAGSGQPKNAADPTWRTENTARCNGDIIYVAGTTWWFCKKCGCCGDHDFAKAHRPINDPVVYFTQAINEYVEAKMKEGASRELATYQMFHIAGVVLKYAAVRGPEDLGEFIERMLTP